MFWLRKFRLRSFWFSESQSITPNVEARDSARNPLLSFGADCWPGRIKPMVYTISAIDKLMTTNLDGTILFQHFLWLHEGFTFIK